MKTDSKPWIERLMGLWRTVKEGQLQWRLNNQEQFLQLTHKQALAQDELLAQLKKRSLQLEHELSVLKTEHQSQLVMLKTKCQQDVNDYKQYLNALEQLKVALQQRYAQLPDVLVFTIHHHAKHLLNAMWDADDHSERRQHEIQFIQFMTTLHEETYLQSSLEASSLPEKTLSLIRHE